jgi:signal transduction histidine kinase/ActR/RegA family two-component response regulator
MTVDRPRVDLPAGDLPTGDPPAGGPSAGDHADAPGGRAQLEARLRQQALLAEFGRRALADPDFDQLLDEAVRMAAIGMQVRFAKVLEYRPMQNRLLVRAGIGWHEGVVGHVTIGADMDSPAGYALHTGKPVISNHLPTEGRFSVPELLLDHGVRRAINVILLGEGPPYGVLEIDSEAPGAFTEHDLDFLQAVANLLGLALMRRRADDALRQINETLEQRVDAEVAERRAAEDALRQAQKMEAVGQLTGGVAHDFNNLLLVVMGNLELIGRAVAGDERLTRLVSTAYKGATRGAQLTSQLLAFARRQTLRPEIRLINDLIHEFDVLATRMLGEAVDVRFELDPNAGACEIDPAQFGSALLNLVVNARDAMPDGGALTIGSRSLALDARMASRYPGATAGPYVVVEIADTGAGMERAVLERATEPFFTTKEAGRGTGLGLSQVYGFVRQSGGFLTIDSAPGKGTVIRIHLPKVAPGAARPDAPADAESGAGVILVVEDDADVRELVAMQLAVLGYAPLVAASGPEALAILAAPQTGKVDLLLTDVVMPGGMNGVTLVGEARRHRPDLKALLTSGYLAGNVPGEGEGDTADLPLLSKPYQQADLARAIREALNGG